MEQQQKSQIMYACLKSRLDSSRHTGVICKGSRGCPYCPLILVLFKQMHYVREDLEAWGLVMEVINLKHHVSDRDSPARLCEQDLSDEQCCQMLVKLGIRDYAEPGKAEADLPTLTIQFNFPDNLTTIGRRQAHYHLPSHAGIAISLVTDADQDQLSKAERLFETKFEPLPLNFTMFVWPEFESLFNTWELGCDLVSSVHGYDTSACEEQRTMMASTVTTSEAIGPKGDHY